MKRMILSVLVALLAASAVLAQNSTPANPRPSMRRAAQFRLMNLRMMKQRLNLTPEQVQQIRQINHAQRLQSFDRNTAAQSERQALMAALFSETPNQAEIHRHVAALQQAQAAQLNQLVATAAEINKVLTPEQRTEFQKVMATRMDRQVQMRAKARERLAQPATGAAGK